MKVAVRPELVIVPSLRAADLGRPTMVLSRWWGFSGQSDGADRQSGRDLAVTGISRGRPWLMPPSTITMLFTTLIVETLASSSVESSI